MAGDESQWGGYSDAVSLQESGNEVNWNFTPTKSGFDKPARKSMDVNVDRERTGLNEVRCDLQIPVGKVANDDRPPFIEHFDATLAPRTEVLAGESRVRPFMEGASHFAFPISSTFTCRHVSYRTVFNIQTPWCRL